jgi:hypothetical protein
MLTSEQEWQRIYLGLALGCISKNPNINIKMGRLAGEDPINKKSYVKCSGMERDRGEWVPHLR